MPTKPALADLDAWYDLDEASGNAIEARAASLEATDTNTVGAGTIGGVGARDYEVLNSEYHVVLNANKGALNYGNEAFTFCGWVKFESLVGFPTVFGTWDNTAANQRQYDLFYNSVTGFLVWGVSPDGLNSTTKAHSTTIASATEYFVACYHDPVTDAIAISINGGAFQSVAHSSGVLQGTSDFWIGRDGAGDYFDGLIAQLASFGKVLSTDELAYMYNGGARLTFADVYLAAPTGLTATANGTSQIDLAWTDNADAEDNYEVDRSPDGAAWALIATIAAGSTSYNSTGLTEGTRYYYRVRAVGAIKDGAYSSSANAYTQLAAPSGLSATASGSTAIDLAWTDNSASEDSMSVDRSLTGVGDWSVIATLDADTVAYQDTGLDPSTTYYYRVRATGISGFPNSEYSSTANATTSSGTTGFFTGVDTQFFD